MNNIMKNSTGWRGVHYPDRVWYNETGNSDHSNTISPEILLLLITLPGTEDNGFAHKRLCDRKEVMETTVDLELSAKLNSSRRQFVVNG